MTSTENENLYEGLLVRVVTELFWLIIGGKRKNW